MNDCELTSSERMLNSNERSLQHPRSRGQPAVGQRAEFGTRREHAEHREKQRYTHYQQPGAANNNADG